MAHDSAVMAHAGCPMSQERSGKSGAPGRTFHDPGCASGVPGRIAGPRLLVDHGPAVRPDPDPVRLQSPKLCLISRLHHLDRAPPALPETRLCTFVLS